MGTWNIRVSVLFPGGVERIYSLQLENSRTRKDAEEELRLGMIKFRDALLSSEVGVINIEKTLIPTTNILAISLSIFMSASDIFSDEEVK